jgi:hypothetical protein
MIDPESFWDDLMPPRWRLTVYFSEEEPLKALEDWAAKENRSTSNLAATILLEAIASWESQQNTPPTSGSSSSKGRKKKEGEE